jgi:uncharacterized protein YjiS (DUF1127 family)
MQLLHSSISASGIVHPQHGPNFGLEQAQTQPPGRQIDKTPCRPMTRKEESMAYAAGNRTSTISLGARLGEIRAHAAEAYKNWRIYRQTLSELQALSPRELADLGLHSSQLRRIALEAAYGKDA